MYIATDIQRPGSLGKLKRETLRRWIEELLANEHFGAAADDIRHAVAMKMQLRGARVRRREKVR